MQSKRTPVREKAKQFVKQLKKEEPDYNYLRELFRHIRSEMNITREPGKEKRLPYVPTEEEIEKFYKAVWKSRNMKDMMIIKTLLYTGIRVSELINVKLSDVDLDRHQVRINDGKGHKDRIVPFPSSFVEVLALYMENAVKNKAVYLFESNWKKHYSDRGIRKIMQKYTKIAEIEHSISPHKLRHFLFTWMKKMGVDDALIQPYSGHQSRKSLEIYSKLSLAECQEEYENQIKNFPV
jgi:integrase/recombinase XerD